jgi:hypothetical protein
MHHPRAAWVTKEVRLSRSTRDYRRLLAPLLGGLISLALYARTLPAGLTWAHNGADGGDLLAAALTAGVPHPTGYPTHQLLLRLAVALARGDPARAGAWLSAACTALAVGLLADLAQRAVRHGQPGHEAVASAAGLVAALAWAASPGLWGQAVIVEVYALNGLICVALLWLAWRWSEAVAMGARARGWLVAGGLLFGLGLGNHVTLALVLPGLAVWLWTTARAYSALPGVVRDLGMAALAAFAGLLVYLYLPLTARHGPPVNWGDPTSLSGLLWVATGRLYAGLAFGLLLAELPARVLAWAAWTVRQFHAWGLLTVLAGLWRLDRTSRPWWLTTLLIWLAFTVYALGYNTTDSLVYLIPAFAVMALWLAEAVYAALAYLEPRRVAQAGLVLLALAALPVASLVNWQDQDLSQDTAARMFLASAFQEAAPNSVILTSGDERTFALWYGVYGLRQRPDVAILNVNLYGYEWYRATLAETHTNLLPSGSEAPPIESLIAGLVARRPVYAAEKLGLSLPGVTEHKVGVLAQLLGP